MNISQGQDANSIRDDLESLPVGNANNGERVFTSMGGCSDCHSLKGDTRIVGPSLSGVAARAATSKPDYSAQLYLYESIISPNAYVVKGFQSSVMPEGYKRRLSSQQIADLVAFLMTK